MMLLSGLAVALAECCIAGGFGFNGKSIHSFELMQFIRRRSIENYIEHIRQNLSVLQKLANELGAPIRVLALLKRQFKLNIKDNVEYTGD